ncbi:hypothetical protein BKP51_19675 [Acinetobacter baumannii]|uniref:hypothetical protein n=1 Tax=Acinetobacter baumannii TaxID=470 RepID=UPI0008D92F8E|nr:hypothetical protein [Acinetobacter baumannii]OHW28506.1 hypothetical protein BKP51_19675 [Acinetobacter baumannii]
MNVKVNSFNSFAFVSMAALAISGGSLVACQLHLGFKQRQLRVPGSEFTAVEITQLTVNEITDVNGKSYNDFTEFEDIRNINGLLKGFIERNKLLEA